MSGTGVVMTRSRRIPMSDSGAAKARSDTRSRRGEETTNHITNARKSDSTFSRRLETTPLPFASLTIVP